MCSPLAYAVTIALSFAWGVAAAALAVWHFIARQPREVADV